MNDFHLIPSVGVTGQPVETIVPGVRPVEPEKPKASKSVKAEAEK